MVAAGKASLRPEGFLADGGEEAREGRGFISLREGEEKRRSVGELRID